MQYFDYIFFRIASLYLNTFHDRNGESLASLFIALLQLFMLLSILLLMAIFYEKINVILFKEFLNNPKYLYWKILPAVLILGINFYRYFTIKTYSILKSEMIFESAETKRRNGWIITCFSILILFGTIGLAIIRQSK
jgi:hypothetical protein